MFIHRILLHLGLKDFPAFELVHIITPIGATFLRQKATQMKASSKCLKVKSSTSAASQPPSSGDTTAKEFVDPIIVVDLPPSTSSDSSIRSLLDTVHSGGAWSTFGGCTHEALGFACGFGEHSTVSSSTSF